MPDGCGLRMGTVWLEAQSAGLAFQRIDSIVSFRWPGGHEHTFIAFARRATERIQAMDRSGGTCDVNDATTIQWPKFTTPHLCERSVSASFRGEVTLLRQLLSDYEAGGQLI